MNQKLSFRSVFVATIVALAANLVVFLIGSSAGATWEVGQPFKVGIALVAFATGFPMLLGGLVAKVTIAKFSKSQSWFAWGVLLFAVLGSPLGWVSSNDTPTGIALGLMHIFVGLAWFRALRVSTSSRNS